MVWSLEGDRVRTRLRDELAGHGLTLVAARLGGDPGKLAWTVAFTRGAGAVGCVEVPVTGRGFSEETATLVAKGIAEWMRKP